MTMLDQPRSAKWQATDLPAIPGPFTTSEACLSLSCASCAASRGVAPDVTAIASPLTLPYTQSIDDYATPVWRSAYVISRGGEGEAPAGIATLRSPHVESRRGGDRGDPPVA